jgi:hypothetical protein
MAYTTSGRLAQPDHEWCSDSGTNRFVTNDERDFVPGTIVYHDTIVSVGGGNVTSPMHGTVLIKSLDHGVTISCSKVLLIRECAKKLMPVSTFTTQGCKIEYGKHSVVLSNPKGVPILAGELIGGLYYFKTQTIRGRLNSTNTSQTDNAYFGLKAGNITATGQDFSRQLFEAHCAYGHMAYPKLRKMLGLQKGTGHDPDCEACTMANSRRTKLAGVPTNRATSTLHRTFMDLGFTGKNGLTFQLFIDDYDRVSHLDVLEDGKGACLPSWLQLKGDLEKELYPAKAAIIRTDSEPCYQTQEWVDHCRTENMTHEQSSRHRHDQNGVVERGMGIVGISYRCMMITGNAPEADSAHALRHANVIRNETPTKANNGWTPREKRCGMKLPLNKRLMRGPLFCLVFAHVYKEEREKHDDRGIAAVYLGYDPKNNTYLIREWATGQVYYTADLTFHPNTFPYRTNPNRTIGSLHRFDELAPHMHTVDPNGRVPTTRGKSTRVASYQKSGGVDLTAVEDVDVPPDDAIVEMHEAMTTDESATGSSAELIETNINHNSAQSSYTPLDPDDAAVEEMVATVMMAHGFGPDPVNMTQARQRKDADEWIEAEENEKKSLKFHDVYEVVLRTVATSRGKRIFKDKPVLKTKVNPPDEFNEEETIEKRKYRLTIKAFTRMLRKGIDYAEKYASTVRWSTIKILIAIAVRENFDITAFDISTFFLYGKLEDEIYMEIPKGWEEDGKAGPKYIWRLKRSLYGLPQAPHCAQKDLWNTLNGSKAFTQSVADDCVFVSKDRTSGYAASGTHVDDSLVVGDPQGIKKFEDALNSKYKTTKKENPTMFVGVQIERDRAKSWLKLHQGAYTEALLTLYNMADARPVDTPMDPGTAKHLMMLPTEGATPASIKQYQQIVGGLMWLMKTRPDMHFTINLLARFSRTATAAHVTIARGRPMRYLMGTINHGIVFTPGAGDWKLHGAADSDLGGDLLTAKSTLGVTTQLGGDGGYGNISCRSHLEKKNASSTLQAETYAHLNLCKEIEWARDILLELGYPQRAPTIALCDNHGVITQSTKQVNHTVAKHFRLAQGYIRCVTDDKIVLPTDVDSEDNQADILTKPLTRIPFEKHRLSIMGPQERPSG